MKRKAVMAVVLIVGLLASTAVVLYAFGAPQSPPIANVAPADGTGAAEAGTGSAAVPEADPSSPLAIEIPGCVCHSDDPKLVEEHSKYRMNQCAGCHAGGVPTGQ